MDFIYCYVVTMRLVVFIFKIKREQNLSESSVQMQEFNAKEIHGGGGVLSSAAI